MIRQQLFLMPDTLIIINPFYIVFALGVLYLVHALQELWHNLDTYLGESVGLEKMNMPVWLAAFLFSSAILNLFIPTVLVQYGTPQVSNWFFFYLIGGLMGDALSTHIIPSFIKKKASPGLSTSIIYLGLAIALWYANVESFKFLSFVLGFGSFVVLWPFMLITSFAIMIGKCRWRV